MLRYLLLAVFLLVFVMIAVTLIITALLFVLCACAVGIPLYLASRVWLQKKGISAPRLNPVDRLKSLYVEGKIDFFEFEQRLAHLISSDH